MTGGDGEAVFPFESPKSLTMLKQTFISLFIIFPDDNGRPYRALGYDDESHFDLEDLVCRK